MITVNCAFCGREGGEPIRLLTVPKGANNTDARSSVTICDNCRELMPFDYGELCESIVQVKKGVVNDTILEMFIREYIENVWCEAAPPSYADLSKMLNRIGIRTPTDGKWSYHNLRDKLGRMEIDKDEIFVQRTPQQRAQMIEELIALAQNITGADLATARVHTGAHTPVVHAEPEPSDWAIGIGDMPGATK